MCLLFHIENYSVTRFKEADLYNHYYLYGKKEDAIQILLIHSEDV